MTWSLTDFAVVIVFVAQIIGWILVAAALWKIKKGPVEHAISRTLPLTEAGKKLATRGADIAARLKARSVILLTRSKAIRGHFKVSEAPQGMWIEPRHVRQAAGMLTMLRQRKTTTPIKTRPSVAQRLGLLPPVLTRLAPLGKVARIALQTLRQLRR